MNKPRTCKKCGAPMRGPNDHDTTAGCNVTWPSTITTGDTSGYATSGPTIWGSEEARRLARYDEAIRLIERLCTTGQDAFEWHKALEDGLDFLADEPKETKRMVFEEITPAEANRRYRAYMKAKS